MCINMIPIVGWLMSTLFLVSASVPFWYVWTHCGFGVRYFYFLPQVYQSLPFLHIVGLLIIAMTFKWMVPKLVSVESKSESSK